MIFPVPHIVADETITRITEHLLWEWNQSRAESLSLCLSVDEDRLISGVIVNTAPNCVPLFKKSSFLNGKPSINSKVKTMAHLLMAQAAVTESWLWRKSSLCV